MKNHQQPIAFAAVSLTEVRVQIRSLLEHLVVQGKMTQNERIVVEQRFALGEDECHRSLEEIGGVLHVTRERVRQIQVKALRRIRREPQIVSLLNVFLASVPFPRKTRWLTNEALLGDPLSSPVQKEAQGSPVRKVQKLKRAHLRRGDFDARSVRAFFQRPK